METSIWILLLTFALASSQEFTCDDVLQTPLKQTHIDVRMDTGGNTFQPGQPVNIRLSEGLGAGLRVIVAAVKTGTNHTVGQFLIPRDQTDWIGVECYSANGYQPDTVMVRSHNSGVQLSWMSPLPDEGKIAGDLNEQGIQFRATFLDADDMKHSLTSIMMLPELEPLRPIDNPPDEIVIEIHDTRSEDQIKMDMEQKKAEQIDLENQANEDDWSKAQLREQQQLAEMIHQEEMEYERTLRRQEEERLDRIRAEIRDKEEFDRLIEDKKDELDKEIIISPNENDIDWKTSGSGHLAAGLLCTAVILFARLL